MTAPALKSFFIILTILALSSCRNPQEPASSVWQTSVHRAELIISDSLSVPFEVSWETESDTVLNIFNGQERIRVTDIRRAGDSLLLRMPVFQSYFKIAPNKTGFAGHWYDPDREGRYRIPVRFSISENTRFDKVKDPGFSINKKWMVTFDPSGEKPRKGLGEFSQENGIATGSILTESGDYRYLVGSIDGSRVQLSTFDGVHAYLFRGRLVETDRIEGTFYSGNHHSKPFNAVRDDSFTLGMADSLSKITADRFDFKFVTLTGDTLSSSDPRFKDKVVIAQIMGSWCPNCMDETRFFNELYDRYSSRGLEIVGLAFERSNELEKARPALQKMIDDLEIKYPVLHAGSTAEIAEKMPQIQPFRGYPTSIFIDREGNVRKVHAGFSGPGTSLYREYAESTDRFVSQLLAE